jgi:hypothetical protein
MIGKRRWQESPAHRGDHEGNRNTIAQGMPECFGQPVVTMLVCFHLSHTRLRVRLEHPAFPAPSDFSRAMLDRTRADRAARSSRLASNVIASGAKQSRVARISLDRFVAFAPRDDGTPLSATGLGLSSTGQGEGARAAAAAGGRTASLLHCPSRGCCARQEPYIPGALSIL